MPPRPTNRAAKARPSLVGGGEALRLKNFLTLRDLWLPWVFHRISLAPGAAADEQVSGELLVQTLEAAMREIRQSSLLVLSCDTFDGLMPPNSTELAATTKPCKQ